MEYVIIFLTLCVVEGTVWLCLSGVRFIPRRREIEVVVRCQREDEGWIRVRLTSDSARYGWGGEKKGEEGACCGRKLRRKRLIWRVKPSQKSICITTDSLLFPQSFLLKVLLPQPWAIDGLRSACLICRVDSVDLNVPLKFITAMEVLESTYL